MQIDSPSDHECDEQKKSATSFDSKLSVNTPSLENCLDHFSENDIVNNGKRPDLTKEKSPQTSTKPIDATVHISTSQSEKLGSSQRGSISDSAIADACSVTVMLEPPQDICRICHGEGDNNHPLIQPCLCAGSLRFVHHPCLQKWILESSTRSCELCRFQFIMSSESKPFSKWRKLDLSSIERRRVICSVSFHIVALICVIWSLWVLLERTADEVIKEKYGWAFWTKLVVVTIGFTGGVVFMYVQCKMYIRLCRRWRTYNRIIYIQDRRPPGQRYCEGSSGSDNQQNIQTLVLTESLPCASVGNLKTMPNINNSGSIVMAPSNSSAAAQSNPVNGI